MYTTHISILIHSAATMTTNENIRCMYTHCYIDLQYCFSNQTSKLVAQLSNTQNSHMPNFFDFGAFGICVVFSNEV